MKVSEVFSMGGGCGGYDHGDDHHHGYYSYSSYGDYNHDRWYGGHHNDWHDGYRSRGRYRDNGLLGLGVRVNLGL